MSDDDTFPSDLMMPENIPSGPDYSEKIDVGQMHSAIAREKMEPRDGMQPMPLWLVGICGIIIFFSGVYLAAYSGGFRGDTYDAAAFGGGLSQANGPAGGPAGGAAVADDPVKLGARFFSQNCAQCHQTTGLGVAGQYPPLAGSEWVNGPPKRLASIVLRGVQGSITVHGTMFNNQMPAWGVSMNDKRISYVLTFIRQSWGNSAPPITPEMVTEARKATEATKGAASFTEGELKAINE